MAKALKSRGMAHSNQMREFVLSDDGIKLVEVYIGPGEILTGSARLVQEARDQEQALTRQQEAAARLATLEAERQLGMKIGQQREVQIKKEQKELSAARKAD